MPPERLATSQTDISKRPAKRARQSANSVVSIDRGAGLVWRGPDYPVLSAGVYTVRAVGYQGPEWIRSFRRWSIRLEFALVHESVNVSAFFNLGDDPNGYRIGRQSRFYKAWVIANGEHPRKGQFMALSVPRRSIFSGRCSRLAKGRRKERQTTGGSLFRRHSSCFGVAALIVSLSIWNQ